MLTDGFANQADIAVKDQVQLQRSTNSYLFCMIRAINDAEQKGSVSMRLEGDGVHS